MNRIGNRTVYTLKTTCRLLVVILLLGQGRAPAGSADGLIAYYPLNGDGADASGNGHNGTVEGATPTANRFGQNGKALLFDGVNSFIKVSDATALRLAATDFTISAWIFETDRAAHFNDCILSKRGPTGAGLGRPGDGRGWILGVRGLQDTNTTGRLFYQVSGGEDPKAFSTAILALNQWHHVAVIYHHDAGSLDMIIDGAWDSTTANIPPPNPAIKTAMHIGNDSQLAYHNAYVFHGKISDMRIYNHAFDGPEAAGIYSTGLVVNHTQFTGRALTWMYGGLTVGQTVIVESSQVLIHWTPVQTNYVTSATMCVTNFVKPDVAGEFFRVSVP